MNAKKLLRLQHLHPQKMTAPAARLAGLTTPVLAPAPTAGIPAEAVAPTEMSLTDEERGKSFVRTDGTWWCDGVPGATPLQALLAWRKQQAGR